MRQKENSAQEVIFFDPEKCTGCTYCMIACTFKHYGSTDFERSHLKILDDPENPKIKFIGIHCAQCDDPLCLAACPVNAITKDDKSGIVKINSIKCIGCKACIVACPISNPHYDEDRRIVVKCDFCDGDPYCVKFCTAEALIKTTREQARSRYMKHDK